MRLIKFHQFGQHFLLTSKKLEKFGSIVYNINWSMKIKSISIDGLFNNEENLWNPSTEKISLVLINFLHCGLGNWFRPSGAE